MQKKLPVLVVGSASTNPDLEYASGFRAVDPVVFLRTETRQVLVVPELEYGRAGQAAQGGRQGRREVTVFTPRLLRLRGKKGRDIGEWAWQAVKRAGVRRVGVSPMVPHAVAKCLERNGVRVQIVEGGLFPERAVKDAAECRQIGEVQQAAVIAMRAVTSVIAQAEIGTGGALRINRQRVTSEALHQCVREVLFKHGCLGKDTIIAGGKQAADPHEMGHGPLRAGETIVIDIFPQHMAHGYWGDLTRTVVRGQAPAGIRKMYHAVKAAQKAALDRIRPGVKAATVHNAAAAVMDECGFNTQTVNGRRVGFIHGLGHGVGLAIHEEPGLGPTSEKRLRAGHVVTVEPGLYYPDLGGIRIEDTVLVTRDGWRYFTPCEKRLEV